MVDQASKGNQQKNDPQIERDPYFEEDSNVKLREEIESRLSETNVNDSAEANTKSTIYISGQKEGVSEDRSHETGVEEVNALGNGERLEFFAVDGVDEGRDPQQPQTPVTDNTPEERTELDLALVDGLASSGRATGRIVFEQPDNVENNEFNFVESNVPDQEPVSEAQSSGFSPIFDEIERELNEESDQEEGTQEEPAQDEVAEEEQVTSNEETQPDEETSNEQNPPAQVVENNPVEENNQNGDEPADEQVQAEEPAANSGPEASDDNISGSEDGVLSGNVLDNDTDIDGDSLSVQNTGTFDTDHGSITINADGSFDYTPDADYNGSDSFEVTITDGTETSTSTLNFTVSAENDGPVAVVDTATGAEDSVLSGNVLDNDTDIDGDSLSVQNTGTFDTDHGSITINADGSFDYTPDADYNGADSFEVTITDGTETSTSTLNFTVSAENDGPVAVVDTATGAEDSVLSGNVLDNDTDIDGDSLSVQNTGTFDTDHGSITINADGSFDYTPDADYNGADSFEVTITDGTETSTSTLNFTVSAENDGPVAVVDSVSGSEDGVLSGNVLDNDTDIDGDSLSVQNTGTFDTDHGSITINADGSFDYTPDADYNGADSFEVTITDGTETSTSTLNFTVSAENDGPVAVVDSVSGSEDSVLSGNVLDNDTDIDGDSLSVQNTGTFDTDHGSITINADGSFDYTPDADYNGADSFEVTITDGTETSTSILNFTVSAENDGPVAVVDTATGAEDSVLSGNVLDNDTDIDGDSLSVQNTGTFDTDHGSITINADGSFDYTPDADYNGSDSFEYTVTDGNGGTDTATINFTVSAENDGPVAVVDSVSGSEDGVLSGNVLDNDTDIDGDSLSVQNTGTFDTDHGSITINADGSFDYTPDADYNGADSFEVTITDGTETSTSTLNFTVSAENDGPVAVVDSVSGSEDSVLSGNVLDNDTDIDGDSLSVQNTGTFDTDHGSITINADGSFDYTPDADYNGADSFEVTITDGTETSTSILNFTVSAENDGPVAVVDTATGAEDSVLSGNVLDNDTDIDGDSLSVQNTGTFDTDHGSITINADGSFDYTPDADYNGSDSFEYTVTDGNGGTDTATINFTVSAENDGPVAVVDSVSGSEDGVLSGNVLDNDTDIDGDSLSVQNTGTFDTDHGSITINADGSFDYTPDADYNGSDSFEVTITDGTETSTSTLNFTVSAENDGPVAVVDSVSGSEDSVLSGNVLDNDTDIDGDSLSVQNTGTFDTDHGSITINADGSFDYTPDADYNGADSFEVTITDGTETSTSTLNFTVSAENDGPVAVVDTATGAEDSVLSGNVLDNDTDIDGDSLSVQNTGTFDTDHGSITINADGSFDYTPDADYSGSDSFEVTITDGTETSTSTLNLTVTAGNDGPVAVVDSVSGSEDGVLSGNVLDNDTDIDGDSLSVQNTGTFDTDHGSITINADGSFDYTPDADYNGSDSFEVTITDGTETSTSTLNLTVTAGNDGPVAVVDSVSGSEDGVLSGNVLDNDTDIDGDSLSVQNTGTFDTDHGSITINADGSFDYTPDADYNGADSFEVTITDGTETSTSTLNFTVSAENDGPVAVVDSVSGSEDSVLSGNVLDNDTDIDGDSLSVQNTGTFDTDHGSITINADGSFDYTPDADYSGSDSFEVTITDGSETSTATISFNVEAVADDAGLNIGTSNVTIETVNEIQGTSGHNTIQGTTGSDTIYGNGGNDTIYGNGADGDPSSYTQAIEIEATTSDADGSETAHVVISDVPDGASFSAGTELPNGDWQIDADDLDGLTITVPSGTEAFDLSVTAYATETSNGDQSSTSESIHVSLGENGGDTIVGGAGNDVMFGGSSDDTFAVGQGDGYDNFDGGAGTDTIVATEDDVTIGIDTGFNADDSIEEISADGHSGVNIAGDNSHNSMDFSGTTLTDIDNIDGGSGNDVIVGSAGDDTIIGNTGNDVLAGGAGDDTFQISQGDGYDNFDGGAGTDTIVATEDNVTIGIDTGFNADDSIEEISADGHSGVNIAGDNSHNSMDFSGTTLTGIDNIDGGSGNDVIVGSAGDDTIIGNTGNDVLAGGAGDDTFQISQGDGYDNFDGGAGTDTIVATEDNVTIGIDTGFNADDSIEEISADGHSGVNIAGDNSHNSMDFSGTTLTGIDNIDGGSGNDVIVGSAGDDTIIGNTGNDVLAGGAGDDTFEISQGDGYDNFDGGAGTDTIVATEDNVTIGIDTTFNAADSIEEISADGHSGVNIAGDNSHNTMDFSGTTLTGIDNIDGGSGNDVIVGSAGDDTIIGNTGNDVLAGGAGDDTFEISQGDGYDNFDGGAGTDTIVATEDNVTIGIDTTFNAADSIEEISADGHSGVNIAGDNSHNTMDFSGTTLTGIDNIDGGSGNDAITGSSGDDIIIGNTGNDVLYGGEGDDTFEISQGHSYDNFDGGAGTDTIVATEDNVTIGIDTTFNADDSIEEINAGGHSGVTIAGDNSHNTMDFSGTTLTGIEKIDGGSGNDTITGSSGHDVMSGGDGTDTLVLTGNQNEYIITDNGDGTYTVQDTVSDRNGTDTVDSFENLSFADGTVDMATAVADSPSLISISNATVTESSTQVSGEVTTVVSGEIVDGGSANSVDHWAISHNGGDLELDILTDGSGLDAEIMVYRDNGDGTFTHVGTNDDGGWNNHIDGGYHSLDSFLSLSDLDSGEYVVAVSTYNMNDSVSLNTSSEYAHGNGAYTDGTYQLTVKGDATVSFADNPDSPGESWGDVNDVATIVSTDGEVGGHETVEMTFTVTLDEAPTDGPVTVDYTTKDGSATTADGDYEASSGTVTFGVGETSKTITITVNSDAVTEGTENFSIELSNIDGNAAFDPDATSTVNGISATGSIEDAPVVAEPVNTDPVTTTIDINNFTSTDQGFTVEAQNIVDGELTTASASNVATYGSGFGAGGSVSDTDSGVMQQTAYDQASSQSEQLVISFDEEVSSADFSFANLYTASYGEQAHWQVFDNGELVAEGDFSASGSGGSGTVEIDPGQTFDQLVFTGLEQSDGSDGSDFMITEVNFTYTPDNMVDYAADSAPSAPIGHAVIEGGNGKDTINGTSEDEFITGGNGMDTIDGGAGDDVILGGNSKDDISGGAGDDVLYGEGSNDTIDGGAGNDVIVGGEGNDTLNGGDGDDTLTFLAHQGSDVVDGGSGGSWTDTLQLGGFDGQDAQDGWTLSLDNGSTIVSTDEEIGEIVLSGDAGGTITFDDGGSIDFENIEKITW